jgi:hypothetical protein
MGFPPFAVSLKTSLETISLGDELLLQEPEKKGQSSRHSLTIPIASPGVQTAIDRLMQGDSPADSLVRAIAEQGGAEAGAQFAASLQQMNQWGWLSYSVLPLAIATPMVEEPELNLLEPDWNQVTVSLSRFAYQRQHEGAMVLESPLSKFRVTLLDWRTSALLTLLAQPQFLSALNTFLDLSPAIIQQFIYLLWATQFLTAEPEPLHKSRTKWTSRQTQLLRLVMKDLP